MKIVFVYTLCFAAIGIVLTVLTIAEPEDLGESPLFDNEEELKKSSDVAEDIPGVNRKLLVEDTVPPDPISMNKFIEEFHQQAKEEQNSAFLVQENLESLAAEEDEVAHTSEEIGSSNITSNESVDATVSSEDSNNNTTTILVACAAGKGYGGEPVELVNSTRLMNILITESNVTNRRSVAECIAVLFYARYCPFSCMAAPHFNALPRAFPDIKMVAVDAMKHPSFNTQYGIVGVPTVMLFHNGRPAAKFNDSEYTLEMFARFVTKYTGFEPQHKLYVTSADFGGPVPSVPTKETDFCLALSWIFILVCSVYFFSKSSWWQWFVEAVQNTWREAEAQHEHID